MKNGVIWIFMGLACWGMFLGMSFSFKDDYEVYRKGIIVDAIITELPIKYISQNGNIALNIKGIKYSKRVYSAYSNSHYVGDTIKVKYIP